MLECDTRSKRNADWVVQLVRWRSIGVKRQSSVPRASTVRLALPGGRLTRHEAGSQHDNLDCLSQVGARTAEPQSGQILSSLMINIQIIIWLAYLPSLHHYIPTMFNPKRWEIDVMRWVMIGPITGINMMIKMTMAIKPYDSMVYITRWRGSGANA